MNLKELQYLMSKTTDPIGLKLIGREIALVTRATTQAEIADAKPKQDWDRYCGLFDLKPEDFGRQFKIRNVAYQVIGIKPSRPKFAIEAKRVYDGKQFKVPASCVR